MDHIPCSAADSWTSPDARRAAPAVGAANVSGRRRLFESTICDPEYTAEERELFQAMEAYKQSSGRKFPTWSEVLEVVQSLGYGKTPS
jgi:hypothetical protein